jgi:hypothetical protein
MTMEADFQNAPHLDFVFDPKRLHACFHKANKALKKVEFDAMAFRGMSGAMFAPILAYQMGKYLLMVRKPGDDTHSRMNVEGYYASKRYVIVDDFTSSGDTLRAIHDAIREEVPQAKCVGVYLYTCHIFHPDYFGELARPESTEDKPGKSEVAADESVSSITLSGDLFKSIWGPVLNSVVLGVEPASGLSTTASAVTSRK